MCGIIGYIGKNQNARDVIKLGLQNVDYRGYDSCGLAVIESGKLLVYKKKGHSKELDGWQHGGASTVGIGHTRWATHGEPSTSNAHPQLSNNGEIAVVHNGIIENYQDIKQDLIERGFEFFSQTDTEVVPNLVQYYTSQGYDYIESIKFVARQLKGSFALLVLNQADPDKIVCIKRFSPLIIAKGKDNFFVASDIDTASMMATSYFAMQDDSIAVISGQEIYVLDFVGNQVVQEFEEIGVAHSPSNHNGFDSYMLKEIYDIPSATKNAYDSVISFLDSIDDATKQRLKGIKRVVFVGCGTAYNAGLYGNYILQRHCKIDCSCQIASELNGQSCLDSHTLLIAISQSGETADTLSAIRIAKQKDCFVIGIVNQEYSTIAQIVDMTIYTKAGKEIAVASTKAYNCQLVVLYNFCMYFAAQKGHVVALDTEFGLDRLSQRILDDYQNITELATLFFQKESVMFLGRGVDYLIAQEAALKMREISYIHAQAYPSGELKHGSLVLVKQDYLIVAFVSDRQLLAKSINTLSETKSRGGRILLITPFDDIDSRYYDYIYKIPFAAQQTANLAIIPAQLLSYMVAKDRNLNIDKPRNLAKSVTVE